MRNLDQALQDKLLEVLSVGITDDAMKSVKKAVRVHWMARPERWNLLGPAA